MSMLTFYILVSGLLSLFASLLIIPLFFGKTVKQRDTLTNTKLVKARLEEMQREVSEGVLSDADFEAAETEVKLALIDEQSDVPKQHQKLSFALCVGLTLGLLVACISYYNTNHIAGLRAVVAAPDNIASLSNRLLDPEQAADVTPEEIQDLALAIRLKLKKDDQDPQGWMFLGRLRMSIGQLDEAIAAFERSLSINPENTTTRVSYAQALMMSNTDQGLRQSQRQLDFLLGQNPLNDNLSLMMAVVSAQLGQNEIALPYYNKVRNKLEINNPVRQSLDEQLGFKESNASKSLDKLSITVSLAPNLTDKLSDIGYVVVFVRPNEQTSGIPIAVRRLPLGKFPINLVLNDEDAMLPDAVLSKYNGVNVTVRISSTQSVEAQAGDLQGTLFIPTRRVGQTYSILIDKEVN